MEILQFFCKCKCILKHKLKKNLKKNSNWKIFFLMNENTTVQINRRGEAGLREEFIGASAYIK